MSYLPEIIVIKGKRYDFCSNCQRYILHSPVHHSCFKSPHVAKRMEDAGVYGEFNVPDIPKQFL